MNMTEFFKGCSASLSYRKPEAKSFLSDVVCFDFRQCELSQKDFNSLLVTAQDFLNEGVFALPYPKVFYRFTLSSGQVSQDSELFEGEVGVVCLVKDGEFISLPTYNIEDGYFPEDMEEMKSTLAFYKDQKTLDFIKTVCLVFTVYLMSPEVEKQKQDYSKLNKKREKQGKEPLIEHITVIPPRAMRNPVPSGDSTGTHASPRPHWRRGHVRHYSDGKTIPIPPCMVNAEFGLPTNPNYEVR